MAVGGTHVLTVELLRTAPSARSSNGIRNYEFESRRGHMEQSVEKLLYSRRDTAEALCLSIRSVDYLITTGRLSTRRIGGKILISASTVRRFAREDHPESVRAAGIPTPISAKPKSQPPSVPLTRFAPQSETKDEAAPSTLPRTRPLVLG